MDKLPLLICHTTFYYSDYRTRIEAYLTGQGVEYNLRVLSTTETTEHLRTITREDAHTLLEIYKADALQDIGQNMDSEE